ncbi:SDR family oxidoreductase [Mesorhizobium sp. YC-39]|uniref:SDR family NAD(P)-dependent oxidoreductase n=1 Tax=unclassified Mesorhizobium TaxID=325217 RepID=UPI0021E74211|nr:MULTISPECIES: SDR family oxidoreductase [unclassified Mesorhizobium]MCV3205610.1 SDR family oxidoreductase [Mesorhizobium sp. YC-2]MCV3227991.1 SDR family oxidoreductase [Mesorhizobium sp. YC-39]
MEEPLSYTSKFDLTGRIALVTGAGQGIGEACATALAEAGAIVHVTDLDGARARTVAEKLVVRGLKAEAHELDVTKSEALRALADLLPPLDVLVSNAGVVSNIPAEDLTDEEWDRVIGVNLTGVFKCCRAFGRKMLQAGRGSIVNIGSMSADIVNTPQPQCHYNASKAGVHHLTRSLAVEWARRGVRVNAVAPTYIETPLLAGVEQGDGTVDRWIDLTPMKRFGRPDEIASVVLFLGSDASSLMTGSIVSADAGYTSI